MEIPWAKREESGERRPALDFRAKTVLALICLCAGAAPLAARSIPGELERLSYGLLISALYIGFTLYARRRPSLREFWQLSFAFFVLAVVQVLNNSVPGYFGTYIYCTNLQRLEILLPRLSPGQLPSSCSTL
jgi:hypothetical protein